MPHFPYKIKFPPGAIKGILSDALQMTLGFSSPQYHYDSEGSTIEFTPNQLKEVITYLRDAKKYAEQEPESFEDLAPDIDEALEIIRSSVMESKNIAQASKYDSLLKKCESYFKKALEIK